MLALASHATARAPASIRLSSRTGAALKKRVSRPCALSATRSLSVMAADVATLVYFKGWGRAEQCRWVLAACEVPFRHFAKDGMETADDFEKLKRDGKLIFGQVPVLMIDGLNVVQSQAIVRHVARQAGRMGTSPAEQALADMARRGSVVMRSIDVAAEGASDFRRGLLSLPFGGSKQQCMQSIQRYAPVFEGMLRDAASSGAVGPFVGGGANWTHGDALTAEAVQGYAEVLGEAWLQSFPLLAAHRKRMVALPGLAAYLKSPLRFPTPLGDVARVYAENVATVLQ